MKKIKRILYPICAVIILFAAWNLWKIRQSTENTADLYESLAGQVSSCEQEEASEDFGEETELAAEEETTVPNSWLLELQGQNEDLAGWLRIPGTEIDYPVMQTKKDTDYYLNHDFEGNEDPHGAPFLDVNCRIGESENLIIYGHHMKDGSMFQNLMLYKDTDFCETNGTILFDTPQESAQYQVIFVLVMSEKDSEDFPYYQCMNLSKDEIYQGFLKQCKRHAIWAGTEMPETGTGLLTLSTCEYSSDNARLVVIAKRTGE